MLPPRPLSFPSRYLRYLFPVMSIAIGAAALATIIDALYRPRAVIARSDRRLLFAAVWGGRPAHQRLSVYRTVDRRGIDNEAFSSGPVALSPDGNMVAVAEFEMGFDFFDASLEILSMRSATSLYYATDVFYPTRTWRADDPDAPAFLVAAQADIASDNPDWTGTLSAEFTDDANNDIKLIDWIAEGVVVGGTSLMRETEWGVEAFIPWWRAMGRGITGQFSEVLAEGIGPHPYTPLPAPTPVATMAVGSGAPAPLMVDGVRQTHPRLAPGVEGVSGAW